MRILCYGDSNTWGYDPRGYFGGRYDAPWPALLSEKTGWQVINEGMNGREIPAQMPPHSCDLLIVMLGTNDLLQGAAPEMVAERMEAFLNPVSGPVLLIAPPPMTRGEWVTEDSLIQSSRRLALLYAALADRRNILFCDAGLWQIPLSYDGVHFTETGHEVFADHLANFLKRSCR